MDRRMVVIFIVDDNFDSVYFTTPDKYSKILDTHNIVPERVKFKTLPFESILLMLDGQVEYIMR